MLYKRISIGHKGLALAWSLVDERQCSFPPLEGTVALKEWHMVNCNDTVLVFTE